jgi:hypothetical protein
MPHAGQAAFCSKYVRKTLPDPQLGHRRRSARRRMRSARAALVRVRGRCSRLGGRLGGRGPEGLLLTEGSGSWWLIKSPRGHGSSRCARCLSTPGWPRPETQGAADQPPESSLRADQVRAPSVVLQMAAVASDYQNAVAEAIWAFSATKCPRVPRSPASSRALGVCGYRVAAGHRNAACARPFWWRTDTSSRRLVAPGSRVARAVRRPALEMPGKALRRPGGGQLREFPTLIHHVSLHNVYYTK